MYIVMNTVQPKQVSIQPPHPSAVNMTLPAVQLDQMSTRHGTGSHFVTQRPSDPGIQRPGDPVDPVTLFYNELQMSTYVADKRLL